jgi:two-component system, LytTR family, response regulator
MEIRAIIIDDELNSIENLATAIKEYASYIYVVGTSQTMTGGLRLWKNSMPDLVFLDIEMHGGTGFEVHELAEGMGGKVVFYTAHKQYAVKALRLGATDYLLKPLDIDELLALEEKMVAEGSMISADSEVELNKIAFPIANGYRYIDPERIVLVKAARSYSELHMDNEVMVISKNIGVVEQMLQGAGFFRCHKSFIINLSKVVEYSRKDGGHILLTNEAEVPVSKERKKDLLSKLNL